MTSYLYKERKGVHPISWEDFHSLCKGLSVSISKYNPGVILGIARGGLYPGTLISHILQKEFFPIRLTRRINDIVRQEHPVWSVTPPETIKGKKILIVDEVCDSGETLEMVKAKCLEMGAAEIKTAVLYSHKKGVVIPDYIGIITDELVLNPWDREIYNGSSFTPHPEYTKAFEEQGLKIDQSYILGIKTSKIAKR
jgi:hypoxanthine phosphoribosyltransferase